MSSRSSANLPCGSLSPPSIRWAAGGRGERREKSPQIAQEETSPPRSGRTSSMAVPAARPRLLFGDAIGAALAAARIGEAERTDHGGHDGALPDQRHQDDAECQKQNEVALGERLAAQRRQRDRQRRRERDDAANAGEGQHERPLPGRRRVGAPDGGNEPAGQVDRRKCPDETRADENRRDQQRRAGKMGDRIVSNLRQDRTRLKPGDQEQHALDQIDQEIPEENALQAGRRADQAEAVPAHVEPDRHRRQHAGAAEMLRRPEGDIWRQDGKGDLDARVVPSAASAASASRRRSPTRVRRRRSR